jgi:hypothetical protein
MTCSAKLAASVLLSLLWLAGCRQEESPSGRPPPAVHTVAPAAVSTTDPCAMALVPHEGMDRVDQEISHFQHNVRQMAESAVYLERLGWAFITKARLSFDPGFYKLAEHCQCQRSLTTTSKRGCHEDHARQTGCRSIGGSHDACPGEQSGVCFESYGCPVDRSRSGSQYYRRLCLC